MILANCCKCPANRHMISYRDFKQSFPRKRESSSFYSWIPAFAGMTNKRDLRDTALS